MRALVPVSLATLLACLLGPAPLSAHSGSIAFWMVDVDRSAARSQILVSLLDFGWTTSDLTTQDNGGALTEERRLAMARELVTHFVLRADDLDVPATIAGVRILPPAMLEVTATHALPTAHATLVLRSTFHELTDDSHRVMARIEHAGESTPVVLDAVNTDHTLAPAPGHTSWHQRLAPTGSLRAMWLLGVEHIVTGYDHLLFLLCLLVPGGTWRSRVAIVTAFTLAHSVTLVLAALHVVSPPPRFVEVAIALSIAYVAIENLMHDGPRTRWPVAFGFGLIHGFGFAAMLDVLAMPTGQLVSSVLAFNLGVELGQLVVVVVAVPLIAVIARAAWHRRLVQTTSVLVCGLAAWWIVERLQ